MKVRVSFKSPTNCFHDGQIAPSVWISRSSTIFRHAQNKLILSCNLFHTWHTYNILSSSTLNNKQLYRSSWILWTPHRGIHSTSVLCKKQDKKRGANKNKDEEEDEEDEEVAQAEQAAADAEEDADIDRSLAQAKEEGNTEEIQKMEDLKTQLKQERKDREKQKQEARRKMRQLELEKKKNQEEERMKRKEQKEQQQQKKPQPTKPANTTNNKPTSKASKAKDDDDDYSWEKDFEPQAPKKKKK